MSENNKNPGGEEPSNLINLADYFPKSIFPTREPDAAELFAANIGRLIPTLADATGPEETNKICAEAYSFMEDHPSLLDQPIVYNSIYSAFMVRRNNPDVHDLFEDYCKVSFARPLMIHLESAIHFAVENHGISTGPAAEELYDITRTILHARPGLAGPFENKIAEARFACIFTNRMLDKLSEIAQTERAEFQPAPPEKVQRFSRLRGILSGLVSGHRPG